MTELQSRKKISHQIPFRAPGAFFFVTICASERGSSTLTDHASSVLEAARHRQKTGTWFLALFLVMPDHLHMLVHIPPGQSLMHVIADFKRYLSTVYGISFQRDFFETRIRDDEHYAEKWRYIVRNPVARGLVAVPRDWPHVIAFDRQTGAELPHK